MKYSIVLPFLATTVLSAPLFEERQACSVATTFPTTANAKLPNPFVFFNGAKVVTQADWACKQKEIAAALLAQELGDLPAKPSSVTGSLSGSTLTINVSNGGKSISFTATIKKPSGTGPFPAVIPYGGLSIPLPSNVGTVTFDINTIGVQADRNSRGKGKFFDLYGSGHSAGALIAWTWAAARVIDVLETIDTGIDPKRIGVTGCSRHGKGAIVTGAFEPRIVLSIPQESGSGGSACWRISDIEKNKGAHIQTSSQIVTENVWFSPNFQSFSTKANTLATDHHELAALTAPRGLFAIENKIDWLGPVSTTGCMKVARGIYKAVGVPDNMGFSLTPEHAHCTFPSSQKNDLDAFINKFLLNQSTANTAGIEKSDVNVDGNTYIDWTYPTIV